MSTTYEDILYDDYLAERAQQELESLAVENFRENILKRYFEKNPYLLRNAKDANEEAVNLANIGHYTASVIFSFIAIELLIKEVIIKPLINGNIINESVADYITSEIIGKMKNYNQYSKMLERFLKTYGNIDVRNYKRINLIGELTDLQKKRNSAVHNGTILSHADALKANKLSKMFYAAVVDTMDKMKLLVDRKEWKILPK